MGVRRTIADCGISCSGQIASSQKFRYRVKGIRYRELCDFCLVLYLVPCTLYLVPEFPWLLAPDSWLLVPRVVIADITVYFPEQETQNQRHEVCLNYKRFGVMEYWSNVVFESN